MLILGYYGGSNTEFDFCTPTQTHDAAAVLLEDGEVVAAIEEERLNRIKHSYTAPLRAAQFVLAQAGRSLADVDRVAIPYGSEFAEEYLRRLYLADAGAKHSLDVAEFLRVQWQQWLGAEVPRERICFVSHHIAHATATFEMSGFDDALVMTIDAQGETESGLVLTAGQRGLDLLRQIPILDSLGHFYLHAIEFLGYGLFDEYKVMGLAPYGDPARFRAQFAHMHTLLPEGQWQLHTDLLGKFYEVLMPRRKGAPIEQIHKDFAASLQEMLERVVMHALTWFRASTGLRRLCLGGGVAHNCTMNGNILRSGLFEDVFVHPAAHDGGNALGAALSVHRESARARRPRRLRSVYWGSDIGESQRVEQTLRTWSDYLDIQPTRQIEEDTADLIAAGRVVGWVQGRSEFGPRALGNRSILADPRPADYKGLINKMVKTRESFRPFAPAVLEEDAAEYFELPGDTRHFPFMTFVLKVLADKRDLLGAVTHVDGTARVQTVSREDSPRFWSLIDAFKRRTGIPVLLNTSFNNNVEPIVDSIEDAIACFLTTGLHVLVVGDFILTKKPDADRTQLVPRLPNHVHLLRSRQRDPAGDMRDRCELRRATWGGEVNKPLPAAVFRLLQDADGVASIATLARNVNIAVNEVMPKFEELWAERCIALGPASA